MDESLSSNQTNVLFQRLQLSFNINQPPTLKGMNIKVILLKAFYARDCIKWPYLYRKVMFTNLSPHGVGDEKDIDEGDIGMQGVNLEQNC